MHRFRAAALAMVAAAICAAPAAAQTYPSQPIRMIVPFPPGGGTDVLARLISEKLTARWKVPVVVENRPGADTTIGTQLVARADPDGYTLGLVTPTFAINKSLYPSLPFSPTSDFTFITPVALTPNFLVVGADSSYKSVQDLVKGAAGTPLTFSSSSSVIMLSNELFKSAAGIEATHIPYKGSSPSVTAVAAGQVSFTMDTLLATRALIDAGKLRVLAVSSAQRSKSLPQVPTLSEAGLDGVEITTWYGMIGPAGLPPDVVDALNAAMADITAMPDVVERMAQLGTTPDHMPSKQFTTFVHDEFDKFEEVVRKNGLTPNR